MSPATPDRVAAGCIIAFALALSSAFVIDAQARPNGRLCATENVCLSPALVSVLVAAQREASKGPNASKKNYRLSVFVTELDKAIAERVRATLDKVAVVEHQSSELDHMIVLTPKLDNVRALTAIDGVFHVGWIDSSSAKDAASSTNYEEDGFESNYSASVMHFIDEVRDGKDGGAPYATGDGEVAAVWDVGRVFDKHDQLTGRVIAAEKVCKLKGKTEAPKSNDASTMPDDDACVVELPQYADHATHVAGTIGSEGRDKGSSDSERLRAIRSIGMAPKVVLHSFSKTNVAWTHALAAWSKKISRPKERAAARTAISNHSWGHLTGWVENKWYGRPKDASALDFGRYEENAWLIDRILFDNPSAVVVTGAGNARGEGIEICDPDCKPLAVSTPPPNGLYNTLKPWKASKNAIVVGARSRVNWEADAAKGETICSILNSSSGFGPTDDGRIRPDVIAHGDDIWSTTYATDAVTSAYEPKGGTSMASPVVAGLSILLSEMYRKKHGMPMRSDELRALLIHTADDGNRDYVIRADGFKDHYAYTKEPHFALPTYCAGWGSVNGLRAAHVLRGESDDGTPGANSYLFRQKVSGGAFTNSMKLSPFGKAYGVRVTIAWIDPPGRINNSGKVDDPTPTLVRDLNLRLQGPSGRSYFPWTLDPQHPEAKAQSCPPADIRKAAVDPSCLNKRDNVEVVDLNVEDVAKEKSAGDAWEVHVDGPSTTFALVVYGLTK